MISKQFVLAGDAIFTIETPDQGHRTYRVQHVEANDRWPEAWFVKLLVGPDNTSDYKYLGKLDACTGEVIWTGKSCRTADHFDLRLLNRVLARLWANQGDIIEQAGYKVHHEGRCGRCGRLLTVPESIENGIGPECAKIMARAI